MIFRRSTMLAGGYGAGAIAPTDLVAQPKAKPTLDYDFYKARVEPIFLKKKAGHTRCVVCHSESNNFLKLEPLSSGAKALERRAVAQEFRDGVEARQSRRADGEPAVDASAGARRRRRRVSLRRPAVHVGQRPGLEDDGRLRQWSDARRPFEEELAFEPSRITSVLMRFGTSPTGTTAFTFMAATSIAVTDRDPAFDT